MMNLQQRKSLLVRLGAYLAGSSQELQQVARKASAENRWFIPEFIGLSLRNISAQFLQPEQLEALIRQYHVPDVQPAPKKIGIVMAGNIPLVGFHDLLCVFLSGHIARVKPSSQDRALMTHIIDTLVAWEPAAAALLEITELLKGSDAYIATGSNNTARHFDYYFRNQPHLIRRNRTSVAVLTGKESGEDLEKLSDDVFQYFGLGCRNVTKIFVPRDYDFGPLLQAFRKYDHLSDYNKYHNNYDYNLAIQIMNNRYYMSTKALILVEDPSPFSPISALHYEYYEDEQQVYRSLEGDEQVQCVVGMSGIPFGEAQCPSVETFADGVDTMQFLMKV